jgi:hypothetical protein
MRTTALLLLSLPGLLLAGCALNDPDFPIGYDMSTPPIMNPVYDDRELHTRPLDPNRKVSEQDCTKEVDTTQGNLRCK